MQGDIVNQGVELMLFGMGTVLVFLTVLVLAIALMSRVLQRYFPVLENRPDANSARPPAAAQTSGPAPVNAELVAAITGAIQQHRARSPRN